MYEKIPKTPENMDNVACWNNQSPSSESAEMRCSNVEVPLITFRDIDFVIKSHLNQLSYEHWTELANDTMHSDRFLLRHMCQNLIDEISELMLEDVEMQVLSRPHVHVPTYDNGTTSNPIYDEPLYDGCSFCRVTEDDIQAAFNNLFHKCFGQVLGAEQKRSYDSDRLHSLFSVEIAKKVNSALRNITGSTSLKSEESVVPFYLDEIVVHVINIIITCNTPQIFPQTTEGKMSDRDSENTNVVSLAPVVADDYLGFPDSLNLDCLDSEEDEPVQKTVKGFQVKSEKTFYMPPPTPVSLAPVMADDYLGFLDSLNLDCLDSEEDEPVQKTVKGFQVKSEKTFYMPPPTPKNIDFLQCASTLPPRALPKCSHEEIFLYVCLAELIIHIDKKTRISAASLDCHQIVTRVKERIVEEQSYTALLNSKNLHITIYKELCRKFGSKYMLLAVVEKDDATFGAAVAETLNAELKKLAEKKSSKTVWRIFRRSRKVAPVSEDKAPESHREEHKQSNRATPLHQNTKCSRIMRTFSSLLTGLRKVFTCCMTCED